MRCCSDPRFDFCLTSWQRYSCDDARRTYLHPGRSTGAGSNRIWQRFVCQPVPRSQDHGEWVCDCSAHPHHTHNAQDKDAKIRYLQQLSAAMHRVTGVPVTLNPAKMIAGLDPEATNAFLQLLASAATSTTTNKSPSSRTVPALTTKDGHNPGKKQSSDDALVAHLDARRLQSSSPPPPIIVPAHQQPVEPTEQPSVTAQTRPTTARRAPPRAAFQRATSVARPGTASGMCVAMMYL